MNIRLYCTLKINDKETGKLLHVETGVYYVDEEDLGKVFRNGDLDVLDNAIIGAMIPERYIGRDDIVCDFDYVVLDEDFDEEDED